MLTTAGPTSARVQLPLRRPGDAVGLPRLESDPSSCSRRRRREALDGVRTDVSEECAVTSSSPPAATRSRARRASRSAASRTPRRRAPMSSTPGRRCANGRLVERRAGAFSASPGSGGPSARRAIVPMRRSERIDFPGAHYRRDIALRAVDAPPEAAPQPHAIFEEYDENGPLVGILIGSESDREAMSRRVEELNERGISNELRVLSAHRDPGGSQSTRRPPLSAASA